MRLGIQLYTVRDHTDESTFRSTVETIAGMVPDPFNVPPGCTFHPRCPQYMAGVCDVTVPEIIRLDGSDHRVACHLYSN